METLTFIVCLWRRFKVGPFSGFPLWSAPQKAHYLQTIELTFFTLLKLKFSLGSNFPNKSEKMFDQIIFYSLKIRLFLLRKIFSNSSLTDKQNLLFFFWEFHWLEFTLKHFKNLLDLYFILNLEKKMFI